MSPRLRSWARSLYWLLLTLAACAPPAVHAPQNAMADLCADADRAPARMLAAFDPQPRPMLLATAAPSRPADGCKAGDREPALR